VLRLLSDVNFHGDVIRGLFRRLPDLELVRAQDVRLSEAEDEAVLQWAADESRILLTHDRRTIPPFASQRIRVGQPMPGVFVVSDSIPIGQAIEELVLAITCSYQDEWKDLIVYFPL
jgi:hypothetical protein